MCIRDSAQTVLIAGCGADLAAFVPHPELPGAPVVLYAGRMLHSKGVPDIVEAVERLRWSGVALRLRLVGDPDPANPASIPLPTLHGWDADGKAEWQARQDAMPDVLASAHVVVLASEREGIPKILLEAAAAGRPAVATDVPGSRDVVVDGETGFLVPLHDPTALADAIGRLVGDADLRRRMGAAARARAEAHFDEREAVERTLGLYERLASMHGAVAR